MDGPRDYTATLRQHLERLKNLIFPLLEQTISIEEEHILSDDMSKIVFKGSFEDGSEKYAKLIEKLEEELGDWR
jgi:hemerythrin-like domain-containing protein